MYTFSYFFWIPASAGMTDLIVSCVGISLDINTTFRADMRDSLRTYADHGIPS